MKIADLVCAVGTSSYFHMDFAAIRAGARGDGFIYNGAPRTQGFNAIIEPAETISLMLVLEDGQVAFGDCSDVAFAGTAGRDAPLVARNYLPLLEREVAAALRRREVDSFRTLAETFDCFAHGGVRLHTALRYGLTQALLHAAALVQRRTMAEIVASEYGTEIAKDLIPLSVACEFNDARQLDRMILKRAEILPHVFFTDVDAHIGRAGEKFFDYVDRVARRVTQIGGTDYHPRLHFDLYGTLGELFDLDIERLADFLARVANQAKPFGLLIEAPIVADSREVQIALLGRLKTVLQRLGVPVQIVADEWCNTLDDVKAFARAQASDFVQIKMPDLGGINNSIEAVLFCKQHDMGACLGGSANETDQSARISAQIALACQPDYIASKPGLGGDEGITIVRNEMSRTLALIHRQ